MPDNTFGQKNIRKIPGAMEKFVLDMLFPIFCQSCQKDGSWLCERCSDKIKLLSFQTCPYCEYEITEKGVACERCKDKHYAESRRIHMSSLLLACEYRDISSLVHLFKYKFIEDLGIPLGKIFVKSLLQNDSPIPDIIIPVPLHKRRLRWRGFNQSEILAKYIAGNLSPGLPISIRTDILKRERYTSPQMKIKNYEERFLNLASAFKITDGKSADIKDKNILLIDDICTTGSTLLECAKILSENGAKKVSAAAIARQAME